jgi:hypothetical protein
VCIYSSLFGIWLFADRPFSVLDAVNVYSAQRADVELGICLGFRNSDLVFYTICGGTEVIHPAISQIFCRGAIDYSFNSDNVYLSIPSKCVKIEQFRHHRFYA